MDYGLVLFLGLFIGYTIANMQRKGKVKPLSKYELRSSHYRAARRNWSEPIL